MATAQFLGSNFSTDFRIWLSFYLFLNVCMADVSIFVQYLMQKSITNMNTQNRSTWQNLWLYIVFPLNKTIVELTWIQKRFKRPHPKANRQKLSCADGIKFTHSLSLFYFESKTCISRFWKKGFEKLFIACISACEFRTEMSHFMSAVCSFGCSVRVVEGKICAFRTKCWWFCSCLYVGLWVLIWSTI